MGSVQVVFGSGEKSDKGGCGGLAEMFFFGSMVFALFINPTPLVSHEFHTLTRPIPMKAILKGAEQSL